MEIHDNRFEDCQKYFLRETATFAEHYHIGNLGFDLAYRMEKHGWWKDPANDLL